MPQEISLNVNGFEHQVIVEPDTPLIYVLRNDLDLKGAKLACGLEQCGACKILIDGQAVPSCKIPVRSVQGSAITTLEGLGTPNALHPLQQAFIEEQAIQCGYCVSGMIIAAKALLDRRRYPSDEEIRAAFKEDLCRCGVYDRIRRAIKRTTGRPDTAAVYDVAGAKFSHTTVTDAPAVDLPRSLQHAPDLDAWVRVNTDGTITLYTGKVELGQGIKTAVAKIGAEELDVSVARIRVVTADTAQTPDEGLTAGSMSLETTGNAIRYAAANARQVMLSIASERLKASVKRLTASDGTITNPSTGRSVTYWDLFAGRRFGRRVTRSARPKGPHAYDIVGQPTQRIDLLAKVTGGACFVHDLDLPAMVHGRVVRPPYYGARLVSAEAAIVADRPGVIKVVRDGSYLAVIAEREEQAVMAMELLRETAVWTDGPTMPPQEEHFKHLLEQPDEPSLVVDGTPVDDPIPAIDAPVAAAVTVNARFARPFQMHASLGPSAAVALLIDGQLTVWTHSQGVYRLRASIAQVLNMSENDVRAIHMEGPGCYGHNGADDAALDAALLARALPGRPVSLSWTRADEHTWEPYGSAMVIDLQASLNAHGDVIDWNHDVWGYTHSGRPRAEAGESGLLAAWHLAEPLARPRAQSSRGQHVGIHRNADPYYVFPRRRIVKHFAPENPLRVSSLRSLGAYANVFAIESFIDELAHTADADPVEYRLRHLGDERAQAVIEAAATKAGWSRSKELADYHRGSGIAFARYKNRQCYVAVVAEVSVVRDSGHILLERAVIAADAGQIVDPDGLSNQLEGGFVQAASWTLKEKVTTDQYGVLNVDWNSYPILRFNEAPAIETVLLDRPGLAFLGSGEAVMGPAAAAIANAISDAVGVRLREIPFTPARVLAALAEAERSDSCAGSS